MARQPSPEMPLPQGILLCLGILLMIAGGGLALCVGMPQYSAPLFGVGLFLGLGGLGMMCCGLCMAMKNLQVAVPGHSLLHPRTGTRFSPRQALAIQRYRRTQRGLLGVTGCRCLMVMMPSGRELLTVFKLGCDIVLVYFTCWTTE